MYVNQSANLQSNDLSYNSSLHHTKEGSLRIVNLHLFFLSIPICIVALLLDVLLIFVTLKHNALKTRSNYHILNYCISNICFLTVDHIFHLCMDLFFGGYIGIDWYCTFTQLENYFLEMCIIFITFYTYDEFIDIAASEYYLYMYKNGYKYVIGCVYLIHLILAFIVTGVCFSPNTRDIRFHVSFTIATIVYVSCLASATIIKMNCWKRPYRKNKYLTQALSVTMYVLFLFLPLFFYYNVLSIAEGILTEDNLEILRMLAFIPEYLAYAATYVLVYRLYKVKKFYKLAMCRIFCASNPELDFSRLDVVPETDSDTK